MKTLIVLTGLLATCLTASFAQQIGIGTANPLEAIHLHGPTTYAKTLMTPIGSNDTTSILFAENSIGSLGMEWMYAGGVNRMQLFGWSIGSLIGPHISIERANPTRVGIGVSEPQETLDVDGGLRIGNSSNTNAGTLRWNGSDFEGYDGAAWNTLSGAGKWNEQFAMTSNIYYNAGFVGIGDSSPDFLFDISNDISNRSINIGSSYTGTETQSGLHVDMVNTGSGNKYGLYTQVGNGGANNVNTLYGIYNYIPFTASGTHYGVYSDVLGSGNYAIYGRNTSDGGWAGFFDGAGHFAQELTIGSGLELGMLHVHDPDNDLAEMYITPSASGSADSALIFLAEDNNATFGMYWLYDGVSNYLELFGRSNGNNSGPHMRVQRDGGNIAIGSDFANGHRLSVDGKIACEELRVELSEAWPDYVFHEEHQLMSLEELSVFVNSNKHLPGIPSAAELEEEGLQVGEMQRRMMEKIEELTLYVLDLHDEMQVVRRENKELKQRLTGGNDYLTSKNGMSNE